MGSPFSCIPMDVLQAFILLIFPLIGIGLLVVG